MRDYIKFLKLYLPLTYPNIIWQKLNKKAKTVLDVGCGDGSLMSLFNRDKRFEVTGIDGYPPCLKMAKKIRVYNKLVLGDIRKISFKKDSFDIVLCSQVIEQLKKEEGKKLIDDLEKIARKQVIFGLPIHECPQQTYEGNPFETFKSLWTITEFKNRGYKVYGQGSLLVYGEHGLADSLPKMLRPAIFAFSYFLSPVWYAFPKLAAHLVCVKNL